MSISLPICPEGCTSTPPPVEFDNCSPEINVGPIEYLYIGQLGNVFSDWTQAAEWTSRIDNTGTNAVDIRQLRVIGEMARPEGSEKKISGGRRYTGPKTFTLELEVDETNATNYAFIRTMECGGNYPVWFETSNNSGAAGLLFGDNDGIEAYIKADYTIPREEGDIQKIMITVTWDSKYHPSRTVSPIVH